MTTEPIMTAPPPASPTAMLSIPDVVAAEWARELLITIGNTAPRSLQVAVGASEIGQRCRRRLAYRIARTPAVAMGDPLKSLIGIGTHNVLSAAVENIDPTRYLVEQEVSYRGIPGKLDLFDLWRHRLVDWKTTSLDRLKRYRAEGPPANYVVQLNIYAAGLAAMGYEVDLAALIFIARDGDLSDIWAWTTVPNQAVADEAIDTYSSLVDAMSGGKTPADIEPWSSVLCNYCPHHQPRSADLAIACPGKEGS